MVEFLSVSPLSLTSIPLRTRDKDRGCRWTNRCCQLYTSMGWQAANHLRRFRTLCRAPARDYSGNPLQATQTACLPAGRAHASMQQSHHYSPGAPPGSGARYVSFSPLFSILTTSTLPTTSNSARFVDACAVQYFSARNWTAWSSAEKT